MHSEGYCTWVCVCVSVNQNLNSGASVRPENDIAYSMGNKGQNICLKQLHCGDTLHRPIIAVQSSFFQQHRFIELFKILTGH